MMRFSLFVFFISVTFFISCTDVTEEIKVADFGAKPNDNIDDTPSIISAIESCRNKKNSKLVFEPGIYDVFGSKKDKQGNWDPSIAISGINNMTIEGNGSEFVGHNYSSMFHFVNCNNIKILDLSVDWDPLPYTQGKVIRADTNYIDIEVIAPFIEKVVFVLKLY